MATNPTAQQMFDKLNGSNSINSTSQGSGAIGTIFGGQSSGDGAAISTMFGGQSQGNSGDPGKILKVADKLTEGAASEELGKSEVGSFITKLLFYGGESVTDIKNHPKYKVNVIGGPSGIKNTPSESNFYKNVTIPRKKV